MSESGVDRVIKFAPQMMLVSGGWLALVVWTDLPGVLTAFQAVFLAVTAVSLSEYRAERGLWMLAMLYFAISVALYAIFLVQGILDEIRGVRAPVSLAIDVALITILLGGQVGFLWRVAVINRRLSRAD
ncbi:hypothetical protein Pla123a_40940 [Posidoniimonas polymericola]|uniref:Uncharacterized protein n=1 Tax=Posidoniimonas polymericola TaxID=2528002 RepID=A0A5C5YER2_9BACT|nr:hypothetical protein [Posidoniimonas polymericola]TWT72795.1 hypothetical protein Pla123a_40940 [Posidoniimonas polymericola]